MIVGLTHDKDRRPVQRLAINTRVAIGMKDPAKGYPKKIDYFLFTYKNPEGEWVENKDLARRMADKYSKVVPERDGKPEVRLPVREFEIVFLSDSIDEVFRTELAWWSATEKICGGDGVSAQRIASKVTNKALLAEYPGARAVPWAPCGDACPDRQSKACKPSGTLLFIMAADPVIGSVASFNTTSWKTVVQIHSSLQQIKMLTGGRLKGIPLMMVLKPGKTKYKDKDGVAKSGTAYFVNIEFRAHDFKRLIPELIEQSATYSQARLLNPGPTTTVIGEEVEAEEEITIDDLSEEEKASVMGPEFYPDNREEPVRPAVVSVGGGAGDGDSEVRAAATMIGCSPAQLTAFRGALKSDAAVADYLTQLQNEFSRLQVSEADRQSLLQRATANPSGAITALRGMPDPAYEPAKKGAGKKGADVPKKPAEQPALEPSVSDMNF
jgi:hypothetical protein